MLRRALLVLALVVPVPGCGGCGSDDAPDLTIVNPGTGEPNAAPLWPLRLGHEVRHEGAVFGLFERVDLDGVEALRWVDDTLEPGGAGLQQLFLAPGDDGEVLLVGTVLEQRLPRPAVILPAEVRQGMYWESHVTDDLYFVGEVVEVREQDTVLGPARTWQVRIGQAGEGPAGQAGFAAQLLFAEGIGPISSLDGHFEASQTVAVIAPLEDAVVRSAARASARTSCRSR